MTLLQETEARKSSKPHWYKTTVLECPLCGSGDVFRERIYGDKPDDPYATYVHKEVYDYCDAL